MNTWEVYLNGDKIDTVFFFELMSAAEVKLSLVDSDGYDSHIRVKLA